MNELQPGFYVDEEKTLHVCLDELLAFIGMSNTPENVQELIEMIERELPNAEIEMAQDPGDEEIPA